MKKINRKQVCRLILEQAPQFLNLPILKFTSTGTVNTIFRLGKYYYIRLPLTKWGEQRLHHEISIIQSLTGQVEKLPAILFVGKPSAEFPFSWAIYNWVDGEVFDGKNTNELNLANRMALYLSKLHNTSYSDVILTPISRESPEILDKQVKELILDCGSKLDIMELFTTWEKIKNYPVFDGHKVMIHADLQPANILIQNNLFDRVIDYGNAGLGDPALDYVAAWTVFETKTGRSTFKRKLVDLVPDAEVSWLRGKAYAFYLSLYALGRYPFLNSATSQLMIKTARRIIDVE